MTTIFEDMVAAIEEAELTLRAADSVAENMAKMLVGRLRKASQFWHGAQAVADLKRELRDFNIQTHQWKD